MSQKRKRIQKGMLVSSSNINRDEKCRKWDIEVIYDQSFLNYKIKSYKLLGLRKSIKLN